MFAANKYADPCKSIYDPKSKTWSGLKIKPIYGAECSLGAVILEALKKNPTKIFQICHHNGKTYTNRDIAKLAVQFALHFKNFGLPQGAIIGIVPASTDLLAPLCYGAWLCGLIISPVEPTSDKEIIKELAMIFTIATDYRRMQKCLDDLGVSINIYLINEDTSMRDVPKITDFFQEAVDVESFEPVTLKDGCNQTAAILRSSGTTSTVKSVCISHIALANCNKACQPDDILLGNNSVFWVTGMIRTVFPVLCGVPTIINESGYNLSQMAELIKKYKVTIMFLSGRILPSLIDHPDFSPSDFSSLRILYTGGCHVQNAVVERAKTLMPNIEFRALYGCSEAAGGFTTGPLDSANHCGQLLPNRQLKIVDDNGVHLGPQETGEICVRCPFPWMGYYKDAELTAATYKDGWLHTNDLGYVDELGNVYVIERKSDVIRWKQQIIYPNEIEDIIYELPDILEASVCGIADHEVGRVPAAAVIKSQNCNLTTKEIYDYVAQRVSDEKKLRGGIYFTNFIPKTATGKVSRFRTADFCENERKIHIDEQLWSRK